MIAPALSSGIAEGIKCHKPSHQRHKNENYGKDVMVCFALPARFSLSLNHPWFQLLEISNIN